MHTFDYMYYYYYYAYCCFSFSFTVFICIVIADGDVGAVQAEHAAPLERYPNPQIDCGEAFP